MIVLIRKLIGLIFVYIENKSIILIKQFLASCRNTNSMPIDIDAYVMHSWRCVCHIYVMSFLCYKSSSSFIHKCFKVTFSNSGQKVGSHFLISLDAFN